MVATAQMAKDLSDHLVRRGHRVTAVASRSIYGRSGAVLAKQEEIAVSGKDANPVGTIHARRVGASIFGKTSIAARVADFALFYLLAGLRVLTLPKPDVVISFTTPPFIAFVGLLCKWLRGSRSIYWVMDLYPDLPVACGVMKPASISTRLFERFNRFLLRRSDVDVVLGRCMMDRVRAKGVSGTRVKHISVWSDLSGLVPVPRHENPYRREWGLGDATVVMYSGNFGLGHDATTICDAMLRLRDRSDIQFVFIGGGKRRKEVEEFISRYGLKNARWRDYVPRDHLGASLALGDIHLISLKEGVQGIMVPSKLFGIMAVARPSIFVGNASSEISRVLAESKAGITVAEGDGARLASEIASLAADPDRRASMGRAGADCLKGRYDAGTACEQWVELIESVAGKH